jgi:Flp pilus assembly protein TadB
VKKVAEGEDVPLSEHEQRILEQIERNFYQDDPGFADRVRKETVYRHAGRNLKWAGLAFVCGLALLIATFTDSVLLGLLGFLVMLGAAVAFERNLRRMGKAGLAELTSSVRDRGMPQSWTELKHRVRERFHREV